MFLIFNLKKIALNVIIPLMSLNNKEISLILQELQLENYWIQKITQPTHTSLILHLYKNTSLYLYIDLTSGEERIHSLTKKMPKEEKMMRFVQLLRSRILGAKIELATQIDENRIVLLRLIKADLEYNLYVKLWSNAANIILADCHNVIIDTFYRREKGGEIAKKTFSLPEKKASNRLFNVREYDKSASFNEAIESEYREGGRSLSREAALAKCEKFFSGKIGKIEKLILKLKKQADEFASCEKLKHFGDLIISNIHLIKKGDREATVFDYLENQDVRIPLELTQTPQENAQSYYARYKKEMSGIEKIEKDIKKWEKEIENLKNSFALITKEADAIIMQRLLEKEQKRDVQSHLRPTEEKEVGLRFVVDDWTILVGRSSKENDALLRHEAKGRDTWLHTRDVPGGFVFIKAKGATKSVPQKVLVAAGNLAVFYSKARKAGEADLYKTEAKNLRRAKGAPIGTVLPYHEKNLHIKLDYELIENLKDAQV